MSDASGGGIAPPPTNNKGYGGASGESSPCATVEQLDTVMQYIAFIADRLEIVSQACVYNAHEHERLLVAAEIRTQEEADATVRALAQDLDVAVTIEDPEEENDGQEEEATPDAEEGGDASR